MATSHKTVNEVVFNGVEVVNKEAKLLKSSGCGANIVHLKEIYSLHEENKAADLDISFSYNLASNDANSTKVKPAYTPPSMSRTVCGHHIRVADDALKLLLVELGCVGRTQIAVDKFMNADQGQAISISYSSGVSRLRIKPSRIVTQHCGNTYVITDVHFCLEYECGSREPTECEKQYIEYCESLWIPQQAQNPEHPFYFLKQVIIAQQLVKHAVAKGASFGFPDWTHIFHDPCSMLEYKVAERRTKVYEAVEKGVGAVALLDFVNVYKNMNIAVLIKKTSKGYEAPQIVYNLNSISGLNEFGEMVEHRPVCPNGGVILSALVKEAQMESEAATKQLATHIASSLVSLIPAVSEAKLAVDIASSTVKVVEAVCDKNWSKAAEETVNMFVETTEFVVGQLSKGMYDKCLLVKDYAVAYGAAKKAMFAFRVQQLVKGGMSEEDAVDYVMDDEL